MDEGGASGFLYDSSKRRVIAEESVFCDPPLTKEHPSSAAAQQYSILGEMSSWLESS
jgi:hypothetical protein